MKNLIFGLPQDHFPSRFFFFFEKGEKIEELDLSSFDTSNLRTAQYMFCNSQKLKAIYVSDKFANNFTYQNNIFKNCYSLTGGMGTAFDPTFVDGTAACIDGGPNTPGYFTDIADKPTSSISEQVAEQPIEIPAIEEQLEDNSTQNVKNHRLNLMIQARHVDKAFVLIARFALPQCLLDQPK